LKKKACDGRKSRGEGKEKKEKLRRSWGGDKLQGEGNKRVCQNGLGV